VLDRVTAESAAVAGREQWIVGLSGALGEPTQIAATVCVVRIDA
jgi:hypothetical protein